MWISRTGITNCNDRSQCCNYLGRRRYWLGRGMREPAGVIERFCVFIWVVFIYMGMHICKNLLVYLIFVLLTMYMLYCNQKQTKNPGMLPTWIFRALPHYLICVTSELHRSDILWKSWEVGESISGCSWQTVQLSGWWTLAESEPHHVLYSMGLRQEASATSLPLPNPQ